MTRTHNKIKKLALMYIIFLCYYCADMIRAQKLGIVVVSNSCSTI